MALDERSRHQLFLRLESALGADAATTLMEHLPPVGWGDVATKRDLDALAVATKRDLDALGDRRRAESLKEHNSLIMAMIGVNLTAVLATASLAFAAARWG